MSNPCVAHRGWSGRAPENTMAAIRLALGNRDVSWIEIDVQLSKDQVPVVIHDYSLRRTTNGKGEVKNWTAAELASLDAGSWFSPVYRGEAIPTLDEVLHAVKGKCRLNIELKTEGVKYPQIENEVLDLIKTHSMEKEVVVTSFHAGALHTFRQLTSTIRTGLIVDSWRSSLLQELQDLGADFLSISHSKLNKARVDWLKQGNIETMAWTPNDVKSIRNAASLDPDLLICTNYPDKWREAMYG
ncbi:glycerophosphodiester phosphodiesterase [Paenibacillus protaetiae]|uniref:Glycerophosphodiester phosphodiesterase n=1 Tax=Paenibacillus protaetiae TaxID=2509456 RepID=A0A4P6ETC2_9BACL|nr:glycerophosphodiester phosphodiesterase family protein [Paenibacillus protaetiae]QAY66420.1 glycerophosphodiester phosphodiesterase [Paenibacillus protaetiae]